MSTSKNILKEKFSRSHIFSLLHLIHFPLSSPQKPETDKMQRSKGWSELSASSQDWWEEVVPYSSLDLSWLTSHSGVTYVSDSGLEWKSRVPSEPLSLGQVEIANHSDPTSGLIRAIGCSLEPVLFVSAMRLRTCQVSTGQAVLSDESHCPKLSA